MSVENEEVDKIMTFWSSLWENGADWPISVRSLTYWLDLFEIDEIKSAMIEGTRQASGYPIVTKAAQITIGILRNRHVAVCPLARHRG